jgi:NADPH:quinone reductase-like Zn-dependent oxidoreductase
MATLQEPTVLVLGASGQIGRFVVQQLDHTPEKFTSASLPERLNDV